MPIALLSNVPHFLSRGESALNCLRSASSTVPERRRLRSVQDCPSCGRQSDTVASGDVLRLERPGRRVDCHALQRRKMALRARDGEVDSVRKNVTQIKEIEGALMGDNGDVLPDGQPCHHHFFTRRRWIVAESIESATHTDKPAGASMIREEIPGELTCTCLLLAVK